MSFSENTNINTDHLQNRTSTCEIIKQQYPKNSILKKKFASQQKILNENSLKIGDLNKKKTKLSFQSPIQKTYSVENWKEYNADASQDEDLCICSIF